MNQYHDSLFEDVLDDENICLNYVCLFSRPTTQTAEVGEFLKHVLINFPSFSYIWTNNNRLHLNMYISRQMSYLFKWQEKIPFLFLYCSP
jgi:hypothetical protein